jgi:LEA14-like dessication related protein
MIFLRKYNNSTFWIYTFSKIMQKKYLLILIPLFLIILGILYFQVFAKKARPKLNVLILRVSEIYSDKADITLQINLRNPLPVSLNSEGFEFEISDNDVVLAKNSSKTSINIAAFKENNIQLPIQINTGNIKKTARKVTTHNTDSTEYTFKLRFFNPKSIFLPDSFKIEMTEKLPTFKFPEITVQDVDVNNLFSKKKREVILTALIKNFNSQDVTIENPVMSIQINDSKKVLTNKYLDKIEIDAKSEKLYSVALNVDTDGIWGNLKQLLFNKAECKFIIKYEGDLKVQNPMINGCKLHTTINGDLETILNKSKGK